MAARLVLALIVSWAASTAFAATVSFIPRTPTTVEPGETVAFDLVVSETSLATFDSVSMVVGSDDGMPLEFEYDYNGPFCRGAATDHCSGDPTSFGLYGSDLALGASYFGIPAFTTPLLAGTLFADTSGLDPGAYQLIVSPDREAELVGQFLSQVASGASVDPLEGRAMITVIPEPASLVMLMPVLAAAACRIRPRRAT